MKIETDITLDDYKAYVKFIQHANLKTSPRTLFIAIAIGMIVGLSVFFAYEALDLWFHPPSFFVGLIFIYFIIKLASALSRKKFWPQKDGIVLGARTLTLNDDGINLFTDTYNSSTKWQGIRSVAETKTHFFIMLDNLTGYIIPKRAFSNEASMQEFVSIFDNKSVSRHDYSYEKQMHKVLWTRRIIRTVFVLFLVFGIYYYFYASRPCSNESSLMYWEDAGSDVKDIQTQAILFTCVDNPEIGFIGHTSNDILEMLSDAEGESIIVRLDNNQGNLTVPIVKHHTIEFSEVKSLDGLGKPFVSCPE
jgi:hypothetical protein